MTYETSAAALLDDLKDEGFTCYVHVGAETDKGWKVVDYAASFVPRLNLYLFADYGDLGKWIPKSEQSGADPVVAIAFGWGSEVKKLLTRSETENLMTVMKAIEKAQK